MGLLLEPWKACYGAPEHGNLALGSLDPLEICPGLETQSIIVIIIIIIVIIIVIIIIVIIIICGVAGWTCFEARLPLLSTFNTNPS